MSIGIQYGPISAALGLAQKAGQAQAGKFNAGQDMDFVGLMQQRQAHADQMYAQQVQNALGVNEFNANQGMQQNQLTTENNRFAAQQALAQQHFGFQVYDQNRDAAIRQGSIEQNGRLGQERLNNMADRVDISHQRADMAAEKERKRQEAINNLAPELRNVVQATGRMPFIPNNLGGQGGDVDAKALQAEYRRLQSAITQATREQISYSVGKDHVQATDDPQLKSLGVAKGFEDKYRQTQEKVAQLQARQQQIEAGLKTHVDSLLQPGSKPSNDAGAKVLQYLRGLNGQSGKDAGQGSQEAPESGQDGQGSSPDNPVPVASAEDYVALPSGTYYRDPNGNVRKKP